MRRSMPARTARRAFATPTGRASACCRRRARIREARVLVFTGRTGRWKGIFSVHSWVVLQAGERAQPGARYDVVGWGTAGAQQRLGAGRTLVRRHAARCGRCARAEAAALIPRVKAAIADYSYRNFGDYRIWPGPNSNTFIATVLRAVPELGDHAAAERGRQGFPRLPLCRPDRQRHRRRSLAVGRARRQARLGRGRRGQLPRPGRRPRSAPSGGEAAGLRPHRHR